MAVALDRTDAPQLTLVEEPMDYEWADLDQLAAELRSRYTRHVDVGRRHLHDAWELGRLLLTCKRKAGHGQWLDWLVSESSIAPSTAERYMKLGKIKFANLANLPEDLGVRGALAALAEPKPKGEPTPLPAIQVLPDGYRLEVGDARHLDLEDGAGHLVITSPPYNAGMAYAGYEDRQPWRAYWHELVLPALREAYRVLAPGGRICLNIANVVRVDTPESPRRDVQYRSNDGTKWCPPGANGRPWAYMMAPLVWSTLRRIGFLPREQLTWLKAAEDVLPEDTITTSTAWGTWCSAENPVLRAVAEPVFIASKGSHTRGPGPSTCEPDEFKAWTRNAWFVPNEGGVTARQGKNPAAFPVELPRRLIALYSYPEDLVIDPFLGSGSTAVAAVQTGRRFYGVDCSPLDVALSSQRVAAALNATTKTATAG